MPAPLHSLAAASACCRGPGHPAPARAVVSALLRLLRPGTAPWEPSWGALGAAIAAGALAAAALAAIPVFAAPARAQAIEGAPIAVMGLSLSMTARQVIAALRPQALELRARSHACPTAPAVRCTDFVRARMPDGWLTIRFADSPPGAAAGRSLAWRIRLTIIGAGNMDPRQVRAAAAAHYGPPTQPDRQLWCPGVTPGSACPPNQPRLRLIRRPNGASVLSLSDPGLRNRLARDSAASMPSAGARAARAVPPAG